MKSNYESKFKLGPIIGLIFIILTIALFVFVMMYVKERFFKSLDLQQSENEEVALIN